MATKKNAHFKKNYFITFGNITLNEKQNLTNKTIISGFSSVFNYNFLLYCENKIETSENFTIIIALNCPGIPLPIAEKQILSKFPFLDQKKIDVKLEKSSNTLCNKVVDARCPVFFDINDLSELKKDAQECINDLIKFRNSFELKKFCPQNVHTLLEIPLISDFEEKIQNNSIVLKTSNLLDNKYQEKSLSELKLILDQLNNKIDQIPQTNFQFDKLANLIEKLIFQLENFNPQNLDNKEIEGLTLIPKLEDNAKFTEKVLAELLDYVKFKKSSELIKSRRLCAFLLLFYLNCSVEFLKHFRIRHLKHLSECREIEFKDLKGYDLDSKALFKIKKFYLRFEDSLFFNRYILNTIYFKKTNLDEFVFVTEKGDSVIDSVILRRDLNQILDQASLHLNKKIKLADFKKAECSFRGCSVKNV